MAYGFGSVLGLPPPPPKPSAPIPKLGEPGQRAYRQTSEDRSRRFRAADITFSRIQYAIDAANNQGNMAELADINGQMLRSPIYGGIYAQRWSGAKRVVLGALSPRGVKLKDGSTLRLVLRPGGTSSRAAKIHETTVSALKDQDAALGQFITYGLQARLTFGGLTEIIWKQDTAKPAGFQWSWNEFVPVPGQRMRFDPNTGEPGYAVRPFDSRGVPVSAYEWGTWAVWTPDAGNPMFGARGVLPMLHTDWFHSCPIGGMWVQAVERFGSPALDVATDDPDDEAYANSVGDSLGSQATFVHSLARTKVAYLESATATKASGSGPHGEFEARCKSRAAIAFLGAEQTVAVSQGQGSQQSVGSQEGVREDILLDDLDFVIAGLVRYALTPLAILNHGLDAADEAARYSYEIEQPADRMAIITETQAAEAVGIDRDMETVRRELGPGWEQPAPGRSVREMRMARGEAPTKSNVLPFKGANP